MTKSLQQLLHMPCVCRCDEGDVVATISLGYADGYNRLLSDRGIVTTDNGKPTIRHISTY